MKKYKCYVFDFDGTLMDTIGYLRPLYIACFRHIGMEITEEQIQKFFVQSILKTFEMMKVSKEDQVRIAKYSQENATNPEFIKGARMYPDALEILAKLRKENIPVAIVSGNDANVIRFMLAHNGVDPEDFISILGMYDIPEQKPSPEPLLEFLRRNPAYTKEDIVYVGDAKQDAETAENAGIDSLIVRRTKKAITEMDLSSLSDILKE